MKRQEISAKRNATNLVVIGDYCRMRVVFHLLYPGDGRDYVRRNEAVLQTAMEASPTEREVMARTFQRRNLRGLAIAGSVLILLWFAHYL